MARCKQYLRGLLNYILFQRVRREKKLYRFGYIMKLN